MDEVGVAFPFSKRLARENGWTPRFTREAIAEYKKFIYLICISPHPLTPSEAVDAVWHLHLIYTKSYWDAFCENTLRRKIHHNPTQGGAREGEKFTDWYQKTLHLYQETFGQAPVASVWPAPHKRFSGSRFQWIDLNRFWLIRKPFFNKITV